MKEIIIAICLIIVVSILLTNCSSMKGNNAGSDEEAAAKILMNETKLAGFDAATNAEDPALYIVVSLKSMNMSGRNKETKITYNQTLKKWTGSYSSLNNSGRAGPNETQDVREDINPKSGWLALVKSLDENNIHTIRDHRSIEYKQLIADGETYSLDVRFGDKQRKYIHSNPHFYAREYPEISDFANFAAIIDLLRAELVAE